MYSDLPPTWRHLNKGVTTLGWALVAGVGVWVAAAPPATIVSQQPTWMSVSWCVLTILGALMGAYGEIRGRYLTQAAGALIAAAGLFAYVATLWYIVGAEGVTRGAQATAMTALLVFMLRQAALCGAQAYRVKKLQVEAMTRSTKL